MFERILKELECNDPPLTSLKLGREITVIDGFDRFDEALKKNVTLKELSLEGGWWFNNYARIKFAEALKINRGLKKLNLSNNNICDFELIELTNALKLNQVLEELDLGGNCISCQGLWILAEMLSINKTLKVLKINDQFPKLFRKGLLLDGLKLMIEGSALEHLDLREANFYRHTIKKYIEPGLKKNTTLMQISLSEKKGLYFDDKQIVRKYIEKFSREMAGYASYCHTYKQAFPGTVYETLITFPISVCDMIVDYCKDNLGNLENPLREEVKECQKKRNQKVSVPQLMFFNKKGQEESVQSPPKNKLKLAQM